MVNHYVIAKGLACLGVQSPAIRWNNAFLSNREQCVRVGNSTLSLKKTNGGQVLVSPLVQSWGRYCLLYLLIPFSRTGLED